MLLSLELHLFFLELHLAPLVRLLLLLLGVHPVARSLAQIEALAAESAFLRARRLVPIPLRPSVLALGSLLDALEYLLPALLAPT